MIDYLKLANSSRPLQSYIGNSANYLAPHMYIYQDSDQARKENASVDRFLSNSVAFEVGSYDDTALDAANLEVIESIFADEIARGQVRISYAISYTTVVIVHKSLLDTLFDEILYPLQRYPCLDDMVMARIEHDRFEEDTNDDIDSFWRTDIEEEYISQESFKAEVWKQIKANYHSLQNDYGETDTKPALHRAYRKLRLLPVVADKMFNHYAKHLTAMLPMKVTR